MQEKLTLLHANNKDQDQPAHSHSLISTFVIRYLESIKVQLAQCKISIFQLVFVAEQASLALLARNPRRVFLRHSPYNNKLPIVFSFQNNSLFQNSSLLLKEIDWTCDCLQEVKGCIVLLWVKCGYYMVIQTVAIVIFTIRPEGYKTFFMLNLTEHDFSTAHKN